MYQDTAFSHKGRGKSSVPSIVGEQGGSLLASAGAKPIAFVGRNAINGAHPGKDFGTTRL
jgi:hypothetical protein